MLRKNHSSDDLRSTAEVLCWLRPETFRAAAAQARAENRVDDAAKLEALAAQRASMTPSEIIYRKPSWPGLEVWTSPLVRGLLAVLRERADPVIEEGDGPIMERHSPAPQDAEFYEAAWGAIPALLAALEHTEQECAKLAAELALWKGRV